MAWPPVGSQWLGVGTGELALSRSESGHVDVVDASVTLVAEDIRLEGDQIVVDARWLGTAPHQVEVRLERLRGVTPGVIEQSGDGVRLRFSTTWDEWGLGETGLPVGRYGFVLESGRTVGRVLLGEDLLDRILDFTVTDRFRFRPVREGRIAGRTPDATGRRRGPGAVPPGPPAGVVPHLRPADRRGRRLPPVVRRRLGHRQPARDLPRAASVPSRPDRPLGRRRQRLDRARRGPTAS